MSFRISVHQPSWIHCPPETKDGLDHPIFGATTPLSINHYLGSWERYDTRDDKRRSERVSKEYLFFVCETLFQEKGCCAGTTRTLAQYRMLTFICSLLWLTCLPCDLIFPLKRYRQRASVNAGKEVGWIDGWLPKFVDHVGLEVAKQLLPNYTTK